MRVLLVDSSSYYPSNPLFAEALAETAAERGWPYAVVDESRYLVPDLTLRARSAHRLGRRPPGARALNRTLLETARRLRPTFVLVVKGAYLEPATLAQVRAESGAFLVNYATDDPFNAKASTSQLLESLEVYDVYACTKLAIMDDVARAGARCVDYVRFGYKPSVHFPELPATAGESEQFAADVAFIGGCDADRVPYFEALAHGLPHMRLALYGGYWPRVPSLRSFARGVVYGREYRLAIAGAKLVVNLVRRANRDDHVMRSFEVPACAGCMLTERTDEHERLFGDGRAAFFSDPVELVAEVERLVGSPERAIIAERARSWVEAERHTYRDRLEELLAFTPGATP